MIEAAPDPTSAETPTADRAGGAPELRRYESFGYMVNLAARLFERALTERIAPLGLTTGQFPVLLALWERDGLSQSDLVRIVRVEQPTMAQTLSRMERDGLIARTADPAD
ncbi:MAG: MarR family transcriptional regulator, partial [Bacteroidales bacterium]|nr:MarR family transcriptional regulator [Bacteroidales bacterium]